MSASRLIRTFLSSVFSQSPTWIGREYHVPRVEPLESRNLCAADPTSSAAEFAYELNRVRVLPRDYKEFLGAAWVANKPVAPLVLNPALIDAAQSHASSMATHDFFSHTDPISNEQPNQRLRSHGYRLPSGYPDDANGVEIIAASQTSESPIDLLARLLSDSSDFVSSQRNLLLSVGNAFEANREIGVGIATLDSTSVDEVWTIAIAHISTTDRFLGGYVFADTNGNSRYEAGEGISDVVVSSGSLTTVTDSTGSYRLPINSGLHLLKFRHPSGMTAEELVAVRSENIQVDWPLTTSPQVNFRQRSLWTNPLEHLDTNSDGVIRPIDALVVINHLNRFGIGPLPELPSDSFWKAIDTNGDGTASPTDALLIINYLNQFDT